jgi:hypothetical protein
MNQPQASRILGIDPRIAYVARYDPSGLYLAGWHRSVSESAFPYEYVLRPIRADAANRLAGTAGWMAGGGQIARQITTDELAAIMTILVPLSAGGFVLAVLERALLDHVAGELADRLEAALQREFGPTAAPLVAVAVGAVLLIAVVCAVQSQRGGAG